MRPLALLPALVARVVLGARRKERLDALVAELGGSDVAVGVTGDVRDPESASALVAGAVEHFGRLDSFVANAGVGAYGGILDCPDDEIRDMIDTNFAGTVWGVRAAVRQFDAAGDGGRVIRSVGWATSGPENPSGLRSIRSH